MTLAIDQVILHSLLICLIAGDAHLVVRTPQQDLGLVARLVVHTLSSVFDYTTHKLKIRHKPSLPSPTIPIPAPSTSPTAFLRSLFLPTPSSSSRTSQDESSDPSRSRKLRSRSRSRNINRPNSARSISFPADLSAAAVLSHTADSLSSRSPPNPPFANHARPNPTISGSLPHAHTDPLPIHRHHHTHPGNRPLPQLPRALVISGLENAGASSQRALAQVLSEKRLQFDSRDGRTLLNTHQDGQDPDSDEFEGLWNLPDGFIVVYVCPIDPAERPQIHKTLLDKFAMSCNIFIKPNIRNALQSMPFSPFRTNSITQSNPSTPLPSPHMSLPPTTYSTRPPSQPPSHQRHSPSQSSSQYPSQTSDPAFPPSRIQTLRQVCNNKAYLSPLLSLYLADLFSATRHHPQLDGALLTAQCMRDAEKLAKAARVVGMDPTSVELLRGNEDDTSGPDDGEDIIKNNRDESDEEGLNKLERGKVGSGESEHLVTEVDIARVFPRCVSHRLRVRDGPRDEVLAGAVFGATFGGRDEGEYMDTYENRPSVKDILVGVLAEV